MLRLPTANWTTVKFFGGSARELFAIPYLLLIGGLLAVQAAANVQLSAATRSPFGASAIQLALGAALLVGVAAVAGMLGAGWLGALVGATYVTSVFLLIPEIGAAPTVALTVAGQQVASLAVDRYGLFRLPRRALPPARLAGVAALLGGVALIQGL